MQNQPSTFTGTGHVTQADRLYYLDWLRVLAILSVLFLHCGKIFDYHTTVVFNTVRSPVLSAYREFGLLWIMPLFFILSGASVFLSLRSRGTGEFIKARIIRLVFPLVLIGTFIINPPYVYCITMIGNLLFRGDTVNTTARIRSECSVVSEKLLVSAELLSLLTDIDIDFFVESKGVFSFKGKENVIGLFSIKQKTFSEDLDLSQNGS